MGCAGDCPGCGQEGYAQVHLTLEGDDILKVKPMEANPNRVLGSDVKYEAHMIVVENLFRYPERRRAEHIYTGTIKGSIANAKSLASRMRHSIGTATQCGYKIKVAREKIELSPGHPDLLEAGWLYREAHLSVPYSLDAWHLAKSLMLPVSVNAGKQVAVRPLIITLRSVGMIDTSWRDRVAQVKDIFGASKVIEEYAVYDSAPTYDYDWINEKAPPNGR